MMASEPFTAVAMQRHLLDSLIGILLFVAAYYAMAQASIEQLPHAPILLIAMIAAYYIVPVVLVTILLTLGITRRRPGLALSPLLFFVLWAGAATAQRLVILHTEDPQLADRSLPRNLRDNQVLIVEEHQACCRHIKLLADTGVRSYVQLTKDDKGKITALTSHRLARGDACRPEDFRNAVMLARAGRTDECVATEKLTEVPDGLLLRLVRMRWYEGSFVCCDEGQFVLRSGGAERTAATWRHGYRRVLTFLPFGMYVSTQVGGLWDFKIGGPFQRVAVGGPSFDTGAMTAAVYGVNLQDPITPAKLDAAEIKRRALALLDSKDIFRRTSAIDLALELQTARRVDDDVIRAVTRLVGNDYTIQDKLRNFASRLTPDQQRAFMDLLFARLEDPNDDTPLAEFGESATRGIGPRPIVDDYRQRAEDLFVHRRDLKRWQYQIALYIATGAVRFKSPAYAAAQERLFQSLRDDLTPSFVPRTLAFSTVFFLRTDDERRLFAERFDLVPDRALEAYRRVGWHPTHGETQPSEAIRTFRERARERAARAQDELVRKHARDWHD